MTTRPASVIKTMTKIVTKSGEASDIVGSGPVVVPNDIPGTFTVLLGSVSIIAPPTNAFVSPRAIIIGNASCILRSTDNESGEVTEVDVTETITSVVVQTAAVGTVDAVATGPADRPWATWSYTLPGLPAGVVAIRAFVSPNTTRFGVGADRQFTIDAVAPSFTVNPPADVLRPSPPFIATLTGTASDDASGVAAVEWQLGGSGFRTAIGTTNWSAEVVLPGLGTFSVVLRARDNAGNVSATQSVTVRVGDSTAPALGISVPAEGQTFTLVDGNVAVPLSGTASDTQTGVALVEWSLDGQTFTAATPIASGDWSTWSAQIPFGAAGSKTITVRASDKETNPAANKTTLQRRIAIAEPFEPKDPDAVFSPTAYLDDLLDFATHRAKTATGGALITRQLLVDTYLQPFADLVIPDNRVVANQPASQVRMCIEVLRRYMALHGRSVPVETEAAYRQAAYVALLHAPRWPAAWASHWLSSARIGWTNSLCSLPI
jgi:hypothetical protein